MLLFLMFDVTEDSVMFGGHYVRTFRQADLRAVMVVMLFNKTIR